jgi:hypothetical protein
MEGSERTMMTAKDLIETLQQVPDAVVCINVGDSQYLPVEYVGSAWWNDDFEELILCPDFAYEPKEMQLEANGMIGVRAGVDPDTGEKCWVAETFTECDDDEDTDCDAEH